MPLSAVASSSCYELTSSSGTKMLFQVVSLVFIGLVKMLRKHGNGRDIYKNLYITMKECRDSLVVGFRIAFMNNK